MKYLENYRYLFKTHPNYNKGDLSINYSYPLEYIRTNQSHLKTHIDISSGRGGILNFMKEFPDIVSTSTDIEKFNTLDIDFIPIDLTQNISDLKTRHWDVLTCLDVLEHIEESYIDSILQTFSEISDICLIAIANHEEVIDGIRLHITNYDQIYWMDKLKQYFTVLKTEMLHNGRLSYFELNKL